MKVSEDKIRLSISDLPLGTNTIELQTKSGRHS